MRYSEQFIDQLITKENISFLGSIDHEGYPNIRAMLRPRKRDGVRVIYFSTNTSTKKVLQFQENGKACVYFCDPGLFHSALLRGTMTVVEGAEKEFVWLDGDERYYPGGKHSNDYVMLRFVTLSGLIYTDDLNPHAFTIEEPAF